MTGLLFNGYGLAVSVKLNDTEGSGVCDVITEDNCALLLTACKSQLTSEERSVEDVISEREAY